MSESNHLNLIDLNEKQQRVVPAIAAPQESRVLSPQNILINTTAVKRDSLDNNPFDAISKQVNLCDDPFESVALAAEQQKHTTNGVQDVTTVNLLGLDEWAVEAKETDDTMDHLAVAPLHGLRFGSSRSNVLSSISSLNSCASPSTWNDDSVFSENVSPIPQGAPSGSSKNSAFNNAFVADDISAKSNPASEETCTADVLLKTADLLRLGKANSRRTSNSSGSGLSDSSRKHSGDFSALNAAHNSSSIRTHLLKLSLTNSPAGSPFRRRSEAGGSDSSQSTKAEHGSSANQFLKFGNFDCNESCDDIDALKPNWVDSETEQDSDLELLRIPMLKEIDKKTELQQRMPATPSKKAIELLERYKQGTADQSAVQEETTDFPDLQELRDKVKRHKIEKDSSHDINDLIDSLKRIVFECSSGDQKTEATKLLENLSSLLSKTPDTPKKVEEVAPNTPELPQVITRQATFHLDKPKKDEIEVDPEPESSEENYTTPPNLSPEVTNIAEQIGKLLGNQAAVNVVQANHGADSITAANPTYIVVMRTPVAPPQTPVRQNTQILAGSSTSPDLAAQKRHRSNSLSIHDKPIKRLAAPAPNSSSIYNTPVRAKAPQRRSTISNYSPAAIAANSKIRKSIYDPAIQKSPMPVAERRTSLVAGHRDVQPAKVVPKNISNIKADLNGKKFKLKCSETARRPTGPLRATIPVKKVAPMIITPSVSSPIDATKKSKLVTSTPIPAINSLKVFPVHCSTPAIESPPPPSNPVKSKLRYSFLSATPNPKSTSNVRPTSSVYNRRRSLSDPKSPKRSSATGRMSICGASNTNQSSVINNVRRFTSTKLGFGAPKSTGMSSIAAKNKENALPKTK